jgi:(p)ppGpp synthase/HD superfamily hydrolase
MKKLALSIVESVFSDKKDKGGELYINHLIRVCDGLELKDPELEVIAILHDLPEDFPEYTAERLKQIGFSDRVIRGVMDLTHNKRDNYKEYITKLSKNPDAVIVKLSDLKDNMNITRLKQLTQKDIERIVKYHQAFVYLQNYNQ